VANFFTRIFGTSSQQLGGLPYFGPELINRTPSGGKNPEGLASVRRCVALLSDAVASTEIGLMQKLPSGGKVAVSGNEISKALARLRYRDIELAMQDALYVGNGFLKVSKADGILIQAIPAHRVSVAVDQSGAVWYQIAADENLNQPEQTLSSGEVIHIRYRVDAQSPLLGISPLRQVSGSMSAIVESYFLQSRLSENLSNAGLMLATDTNLTKEQIIRLKQVADEQTSGFKAGGSIILANGLKPVDSKISLSIKDADLIEALRFSVEEVSRIYGVDPSQLAHSQNTSFATAAEMRRAFLSSTLKPLLIRVADAFNEALLSSDEQDQGLRIEFDAADFGAGKELAETLSTLVNSGILTANESRNRMGLPDFDAGDIPRVPANVMPAGDWSDYYKQPSKAEPLLG
jgi:HK97 family phage portal protein